MMILHRNWRRDASTLLLTIEGVILIAAFNLPGWFDVLLVLTYACGLVVLSYGDFMQGAYDNTLLEAENEVLKATNVHLTQMVEEHIYGRKS